MTDPARRGPGLVRLIRQASAPLAPLPPPDLPPELEALASPSLPPLPNIQAVLFDIYGTLFVSAAGNIDAEPLAPDAPQRDSEILEAGGYGYSVAELRDYFQGAAQKRHDALRGKTPYPELRVEELWAEFLAGQGRRAGDSRDDIGGRARELALRYELAVNPAWPMPGAAETIGQLRDRGIVLGLISNAQFFTPLLFEAFFGAPLAELGFDPELLIYSFELGEAKPSPALFAPATRRLEALGLRPENALHVGNDMLNDIAAAARAGFRTALFAGDRRSLRLREGDGRGQGIQPDRVVRSLGDVAGLIG